MFARFGALALAVLLIACAPAATAHASDTSVATALPLPNDTSNEDGETVNARRSRRARLYAATTDGGDTGAAVAIHGGPPWQTQLLADTDGGQFLREFGGSVYVVSTPAGTITRTDLDGRNPELIDLGADSQPVDVHVVGRRAYITRRNDAHLLLHDLRSGRQRELVDLSTLATQGESVTVETMERDGRRLFVGVTLTADRPDPDGFFDRGVLAVFDLRRRSLIDVDPSTAGVQGIELQGAPPRFKMQIVSRTMFVSATQGRLDSRGAIEMIDLDALVSKGFALSERQVGDLGGFVMTSAEAGYFVFHTDIVASTHLKPFTIENGPAPGPEMLVLLDATVDNIAHDPIAQQIYLPSGFAGFGAEPGLYVFDTRTDRQVGDGPIDTGMRPHDVVVAPSRRRRHGHR